MVIYMRDSSSKRESYATVGTCYRNALMSLHSVAFTKLLDCSPQKGHMSTHDIIFSLPFKNRKNLLQAAGDKSYYKVVQSSLYIKSSELRRLVCPTDDTQIPSGKLDVCYRGPFRRKCGHQVHPVQTTGQQCTRKQVERTVARLRDLAVPVTLRSTLIGGRSGCPILPRFDPESTSTFDIPTPHSAISASTDEQRRFRAKSE